MNQSKKITDGAMLVALYFIFMLVALFLPVPIITLLILALLPTPFIIYAYKHNWKASLIMLGVALILSLLIFPTFSIPVTILAAAGGITIGTFMKRKLSPYETLARGTAGFVFGLLFVFLFTQFVLNINWATEIGLILDQSLEVSKEMMVQFGIGQQAEDVLTIMEESLAQVKDLIPVGIVIIAVIMAFLSQWTSYKIINRLEGKKHYFPPFRNLRFPVTIVWIYFFSLILILFNKDTTSTIYIAANNVLSLVGLFMVIQGFSFMFFYTHFRKWSKAIPIIGVVLTLILPFLLLYLVRILGIIDIGFGLRERLTKKK